MWLLALLLLSLCGVLEGAVGSVSGTATTIVSTLNPGPVTIKFTPPTALLATGKVELQAGYTTAADANMLKGGTSIAVTGCAAPSSSFSTDTAGKGTVTITNCALTAGSEVILIMDASWWNVNPAAASTIVIGVVTKDSTGTVVDASGTGSGWTAVDPSPSTSPSTSASTSPSASRSPSPASSSPSPSPVSPSPSPSSLPTSPVQSVTSSADLEKYTESDILAMTDAQRKARFVVFATTAGLVVVITNNYGGAQIMLFIPVPGTIKLVTNDDTLDSTGSRVYLSIVPCASSGDTSQCEEAAAIWTKCPKRVAGIAQLFTGGNTNCVANAFVGCSIVRMRSDGSIISNSYLTVKISPCPSGVLTSPIDASSCTAGSVFTKGSDGSCSCVVPKTSVVTGSTSTNSSTSSGGSNTGLFYIIFVLMIIPIALLIAACLYYYFYHYRPARESEQYLAPCCAAPGYAYPPQMLTNTPAVPVAYI